MKSLGHGASFVWPSRIRALVVPIGKWKRHQFNEAVENLQSYSEIRLLDITPIDSSLFTPQGFPNGRLFFDFSSYGYNDSLDLFLYDFEPFRKIFVVIGLINDDNNPESSLQTLKERYPTIISHNVIVTNTSGETNVGENIFYCGQKLEDNLETILCDVGKNFLQALSQYYSSYKHVTLRSPGAIGGNSVMKTTLTRQVAALTAVVSPSSTNASKRLSSIEITTNNIKRSASLKLAKSLSSSENRSHSRSRGRQLKILGNFQLLAGRYTDALNSFNEAVTLLHKIRDYLWLGSALDGVAICFLLLSYLQIPFQIPPLVNVLCPIQPNNIVPEGQSPRNSVQYTPMKSPRDSTSSLSSVAAVDVESINLPKLIKSISEKIMYYYELSLSHTCDYTPQTVYSEILLKTLTFMVVCQSGSELSLDALKLIIQGSMPESPSVDEVPSEALFTRGEIYSFANRVFDLQLKKMEVESQCKIYVNLAQIYGSLGFERKKAFVLRLLLVAIVSDTEHIQWHEEYKERLQEMVKLYGIEDGAVEKSSDNPHEVSWLILQKKCLQLCLTVSTRVNDNEAAAHYTSVLICRYAHLLTQSEQQALFKSYMQPLILEGYIQSYWDPFLLRELKFVRLESNGLTIDGEQIPIETEIIKQNDSVVDIEAPQVFNPFKALQATSSSKNNESAEVQGSFLVGDKAMISCMVQNPFKFEIGITGVQFDAEMMKYCELDENEISLMHPVFVPAESMRLINLPLTLKKPTFHKWLTIDSLNVSVLGMSSKVFKIVATEKKGVDSAMSDERCIFEKIQIKILPEQPELQLLRTENISDNSWMMLHGTKKKVSITVRNKSLSCPIEYLQFSSISNIEKSMKPDYWKKLPADDLFGIEKQLQWLKNSFVKILNAPSHMAPNEVITIDVEVDATSAPLQFNGFDLIANYGMRAGDGSCIYLKKLRLPYEVFLKRSIEVPGLEVIPLNELFSPKMESVDWIKFIMKKAHSDKDFHVGDYALLLIDIRNSWIDGVDVKVEFEDFHGQSYMIEADHTTRVIVPFKKLGYETTNLKNKAIPRVFPGRQYIQSGLREEQEFEMRETFWCREHVLSKLHCQWHLSRDPTKTGVVDFRQFLDKFDERMVSIMYANKLPYHVELELDKCTIEKGQSLCVKATVTPTQSRQSSTRNSMLLLNFMLFDNQTCKLLPKSNRRILYNGTLNHHIMATKKATINLTLLPIETGNYEIFVSIASTDGDESTIQFNSGPVTFQVN